MAASGLCADILSYIKLSSDIEFAWSENKGLYEHTAIVLNFDGTPVFTIDYGQEGGHIGSSGTTVSRVNRLPRPSHQALGASSQVSAFAGAWLLPGSDLRVNGFKLSKTESINRIAKFLIESFDMKKIVTDLLVDIGKIKMGKYSVLNNNCRHFVEKAIKLINEALNRKDDGSLRGIQRVKRQDKMKIGAGVGVAIASALLGGSLQRK